MAQQPPAGQEVARPHRTFWLTVGPATIGAAVIALIGTLIAGQRGDGSPASPLFGPATGSSAGPSAGPPPAGTSSSGTPSSGTSSGAAQVGPGGSYVVRYEHVGLRVLRPDADNVCGATTVAFEGDAPTVKVGSDVIATIGDTSLDLIYGACSDELSLTVPDDDKHAIARVAGPVDAAACASATNLDQIAKRIPADELVVGQYYCMRTYHGYIVEFGITASGGNHDLSLVATAWRDH